LEWTLRPRRGSRPVNVLCRLYASPGRPPAHRKGSTPATPFHCSTPRSTRMELPGADMCLSPRGACHTTGTYFLRRPPASSLHSRDAASAPAGEKTDQMRHLRDGWAMWACDNDSVTFPPASLAATWSTCVNTLSVESPLDIKGRFRAS
jgi:hypothetical protein